MTNKAFAMLGKVRQMLSRYPDDPVVRPRSFKGVRRSTQTRECSALLAFQCVPDKFYFLLFGAIRAQLATRVNVRAELVIVQAVSGAVGMGLWAELKRSALVAWLWCSRWARAYGDLIDGIAYRCATWAYPFLDLLDWFRSRTLWLQLQTQGQALSLMIDGIDVTDLLTDSYLRFKPSPEFDVTDPFVRRLVWQALRDVRQAHAYFGKYKPRWYLTSYATYLEHGIPVRVALSHGVEVWSFGNLNGFGKRLTQEDVFHTQNFAGYKEEFEVLDQQEKRLEDARQQLERRLSGGIDVAISYMRRSAYGQNDTDLPPGLDGAVVVFLHDFYDSPNIYPGMVFSDFWRWVCFTVDVLQSSNTLFFIKPHPNQIALSDEALERLRKLYPDLRWLPNYASNVELAQAGIACGITVYGTVAHELAYLGIPSICCARHPHFSFNFCRTARTQEEYKGMLESYEIMPLPKAEMQQQALAFYYMHNLHGTSDQLDLRNAYVAFWKACNIEPYAEAEVMQSYSELVGLPAFERFVVGMVTTQEGLRRNAIRI